MFTNNIDDARTGLFRVVKVSETVGQSGAKMEQCCSRSFGHVLVLDALPRTASTRQVQKTLLRERWTLGRDVGR